MDRSDHRMYVRDTINRTDQKTHSTKYGNLAPYSHRIGSGIELFMIDREDIDDCLAFLLYPDEERNKIRN